MASEGVGDLPDRLARVESRNVTFLDRPPPFWTHATGAAVRDADGRSYLDLNGAFGVAFAGHRHPRVTERIRRQAERLVHGMGDVHPPAVKVEFLERLAERLPWADSRTILGLSGSDAVEAALKTAQLATGRIGVIAFEGSYHGLSLGALATTHRGHFRRPFVERLVDHVAYLPFPTAAGEEPATAKATAVLEQARTALADPVGGRPVGAVIIEPIQGRGGVRIPPPGFLAALQGLTRDAGALLIADEIFTGLGRTGAMYGCDHDGVTPDLICVGKALGGGMPLSACCGPAEVMDAWPPSTGEAIHTSTFLGHPLSCAAGLGFLEALEEDDLAGRAERLGSWALDYLRAALEGDERVREVRGRGLMLGVELAGRAGTPEVAADHAPDGSGGGTPDFPQDLSAGRTPDPPPGVEVAARALERGVIVLPAGEDGSVVELTPPATISRDDLEKGLETLVKAIATWPRSRSRSVRLA